MNIPPELQPKTEPSLEVAVAEEENGVIVPPDSVTELEQRTGMFMLARTTAQQMSDLGVLGDGPGAVKIANGYTMLTQSELAKCMQKISQLMESGCTQNNLHKCASSLSALAKAMTQCNNTLTQATKNNAGAQPMRNKGGFQPGMAVQVNISNALPKPEELVNESR